MRSRAFVLVIAVASLVLGGCSADRPSYEEVRAEAVSALAQVNDLVPGLTTPRPRPEQKPYGCGEDLLSGAGTDSAFYTGYWEVEVADDVDVPKFIAELPSMLGDNWTVEDLGVNVPFAQVHLLRKAPHLSLTVEQRNRNGKQGIDMLVMSRCGTTDRSNASSGTPSD